MGDRLKAAVPAVISLTLFLLALFVLRRELHAVTWRELSADMLATPGRWLAMALAFTALNYAVLTGYDFLAFAYAGKRLAWSRIALASLLAYAIANNVGFAMLSGASVRYRFYTRWGVSAIDLSRIVFAYAVTFWLGLLFLGGISLAVSPLSDVVALPRSVAVVTGSLLALVSIGYVLTAFVRSAPIRFRTFELPMPAPPIAAAQLAVSVVDWMLAAAVLYALLPAGAPFLAVLGAFVIGQLLGLASHVPGGLGVFEGTMVLLLNPFVGSGAVLPALVVYRVVYYLVPLVLALVVLVADELRQRRAQTARVTATAGRIAEQLTPPVLAAFTFLSGVVLLFSGATPAGAERLAALDRVVPLGVIEASHFVGSVVGASLLLLSQGLARRLDSAWVLTAVAIAVGIGSLLLKGGAFQEALVLAIVLAILWRARPAFDRPGAFFDTRFSAGWVMAIVGAMGASIWLGMFAFKHVEYSNQLWWQFALGGEASRFLRASVGAALLLLLFALARLLAYAPHEIEEPDEADLAAAAAIISTQSATYPFLAFLRDKALLFNEDRTGFVMYGVHRRTWVALGDPVGPADRAPGLIRMFLERCDDYGGVPVFYQVGKNQLHRYADFGLTFVKLGEEARVDLAAFTMEGGRAARYRQVLRNLSKSSSSFRIVRREEVPRVIDQLRAVSDDWMREKSGGEKGFSLGFFDPAYLSRFAIGVIEHERRIVAFANIWEGPQHDEISTDLMRHGCGAPRDAMEALFVHLLVWAKAEGYRWFSMGMAPLSGFEQSPLAPMWSRVGSFVYAHGEAFYHFKGLRGYKEKFHPVWEPRYLVYPGGFRLPQILADVAVLVAGGYRRILLK